MAATAESERLHSIISKIKYRNSVIRLEQMNGAFFVRVGARVPDVNSGKPFTNFGPIHRIPMNVNAITLVNLVYQCIRENELHELAEFFFYDGVRVYDPHTYVSFAEDDLEDVKVLRGQSRVVLGEFHTVTESLIPKGAFNSVDSEGVRKKLRGLIGNCERTVVHLSSRTASSDWVKWEVQTSRTLGKQIIAAYDGETIPAHEPDFLDRGNIPVLSWHKIPAR
ncbi:MAG TPA: TIR domain-containing protein [Terriglobales bacterium]|nr:TIR domain-containing protein [Terriglobales bacterium]